LSGGVVDKKAKMNVHLYASFYCQNDFCPCIALHEIIYALEQNYRGSDLIATVSAYTPSPLAHWAQAQPTLLVQNITCCAHLQIEL